MGAAGALHTWAEREYPRVMSCDVIHAGGISSQIQRGDNLIRGSDRWILRRSLKEKDNKLVTL